jgi:hypothetical protein
MEEPWQGKGAETLESSSTPSSFTRIGLCLSQPKKAGVQPEQAKPAEDSVLPVPVKRKSRQQRVPVRRQTSVIWRSVTEVKPFH